MSTTPATQVYVVRALVSAQAPSPMAPRVGRGWVAVVVNVSTTRVIRQTAVGVGSSAHQGTIATNTPLALS